MIASLLLLLASLNLDEGIALYRAFEYEQATFKFQQAAVAADLTSEERAVCLAWLGLAQAGYGDLEAAERSFASAVAQDANVMLPEQASPKVTELFAKVKANAPKQQPTVVVDDKTPPPPPPPEQPAGMSWLVIPGGIGAGLGVIAGVGAGIASALAFQKAEEAKDQTLFQSDAKQLVDDANNLITIGIALGATSGVLLAGGGTALALGLLE